MWTEFGRKGWSACPLPAITTGPRLGKVSNRFII